MSCKRGPKGTGRRRCSDSSSSYSSSTDSDSDSDSSSSSCDKPVKFCECDIKSKVRPVRYPDGFHFTKDVLIELHDKVTRGNLFISKVCADYRFKIGDITHTMFHNYHLFENKIRILHDLSHSENVDFPIRDYNNYSLVYHKSERISERNITFVFDNLKIIDYIQGKGFDVNIEHEHLIIKNINIKNYWKSENEFDRIIMQTSNELFNLYRSGYLEYFIENHPEIIPYYLNTNLEEYPKLLELTHNDSSYQELLLTYGFKYLNSGFKLPYELALNFVDMGIANYNKLSEMSRVTIFKLILNCEDSSEVQSRRNQLFKLFCDLGMTRQVPDIKLDVETLILLGKMIK